MPVDKSRFRFIPRDPFFKYTNQPVIQYEKPIKGDIIQVIQDFEIKETWDNPSDYPILVGRETWETPNQFLYDNMGTITGWRNISTTSGLGDVATGVGFYGAPHLGKFFKSIIIKLRKVGNPNGNVNFFVIQKDNSGLGGRTIFSTGLGTASSISPSGQDFIISLSALASLHAYIWHNDRPLAIMVSNNNGNPSGNRIEIAEGVDVPNAVKVSSSLMNESTGNDIWGRIN